MDDATSSASIEDRRAQLRALWDSQANAELPPLVEEVNEPSEFEQWWDAIQGRMREWLDSWFGSDAATPFDMESFLRLCAYLVCAVILASLARYLFLAWSRGSLLGSPPLQPDSSQHNKSEDRQLAQALAEGDFGRAMLLRWQAFQRRCGLQRHMTPLEFCRLRSLSDRGPVLSAYRQIFGHEHAYAHHYQEFDRWLLQWEGQES